MVTKLSINPARESDLPSIKWLLQELIEAMTDAQDLDLEQSIENCRRLLADPAHHLLVARDKENIIGFINFTTRNTLLHPAASGLIDELVVDRNYRGSGVGRQLIQAAIKKCHELGCCEVEVSTEKSNTRARRFYTACDFAEDAVLFEKQL